MDKATRSAYVLVVVTPETQTSTPSRVRLNVSPDAFSKVVREASEVTIAGSSNH